MRILRSRLLQAAQDAADAEASDARRSRSARSTAPSGSAPTTSPRTGSPTTAPATSPTTSTRCSTATSSRCSTRASRPTSPPGSRRWSPECGRAPRVARPPPGCATPASPRPERDADLLLAHVLGVALGPAAARRRPRRRRAEAYDALVARRAAREPLQHLTGSAAFRHVELAVGPGVFVPRPETELLAGWAIDQPRRAGPPGRRGRPLHRLGRDRPGDRRRGPGTPTSTPSSSTRAPSPGPSATWPAPASTCATATWPPPSTTCSAPSTWSSATRPTSRWRPGSRWPPRRATTTRTSPSSPARTGSTRCGCSSAAPPLLLRPGGVVGAEHADVQGESAPAVFAATGRWPTSPTTTTSRVGRAT